MGFREEICSISCVLISYSNIGPFIECHIKIFNVVLQGYENFNWIANNEII